MGKRVPRSCIIYSKKKLLNPRVFPISRQFLSKRVPRSYVYPKKKTDNNFEDHISQLPNEILIHILSLLTLKEAGRSSALAHRWRDLWKFTPVLNFEAPESVRFYGIKHTEQERSKFVTWVNQVLKLHHCLSLDEFRVCFDLCDLSSEASHDIDEWINLVIPKGVKRLELDLVTYFKGSRYTLSHKSYSCFKSPSNSSSIKFLTSLTLKDVNVNGELLEFLLSNCPLLETLCVFRSEHIVNLRVAGSSLQLKHLEIFRCKRLESLEVSAPNLVTFKYFGQRIRLHIGNLPLLSKLHIGGGYGDQVTYALVAFSSHLSQIATLELEMFFKDNREIQVPQLSNLEHLKLKIFDVESLSLLGLTSLLEAAPSLRKFTLELHSCRLLLERKPKVLKPHPHQCLKDVEMFGFVGGTTDLEIVMYLLQSTINLEKIVIDPYNSFVRSRKESKEKEAARKRAHQLEVMVLLWLDLREVPCHDTGVVSVNGANTGPHDFTNNAGAPPPEYCWNGGCVGLVFIRRH